MRIALILLLCLSAVTPSFAEEKTTPATTGPGYIWWEGENAVSTDFQKNPWLEENMDKHCSGGMWLTNGGKPRKGGYRASYKIEIPENGVYELWARQGYRGWCSNWWRFDNAEWKEAKITDPAFNYVSVAKHRSLGWTYYGQMKLSKGNHTFEVKLDGEKLLMAFDCFILSRGRFTPFGKNKPDDSVAIDYKKPVGDSKTSVPVPDSRDWWAFRPPADLFDKSAIDLSFMNHKIGTRGFVGMKEGRLVFADGTPVRFWGANCGFWQGKMIFPSHKDADFLAKRLSRLGVNCIRLHIMHATNSLVDTSRDDTQHFDKERLDKLDYLLSALKKEGIYSLLSLQYNRKVKKGDDVPDDFLTDKVKGSTSSVSFFDPKIKELNAKFFKDFLLHLNPYTEKKWIDDPAIAIVEIHNEDSMFWWSLDKSPPDSLKILEKMWNEWLALKYDSTDALKKAWKVEGYEDGLDEGESLEKKNIKRLHVWFTSTDAISPDSKNGGKKPKYQNRASDLMEFLYSVERDFYRDTIKEMQSWGVKVPFVTSNWKGTDLTTRLVLWASSEGGVVDQHNYFGGNRSMLSRPGDGLVSEGFNQIKGRAYCVSEWNVNEPNDYAPESAPLMAVTAAFQGWDAMFQFCLSSADWPTTLTDACVISPSCYLQYPLAALLFRRGDVKEGDVIYERKLSPKQLFAPKLLDKALSKNQWSFTYGASEVPPEILAAGRAVISYVPETTESKIGDLSKLWDKQNKTVRSNTGQLTWDYGNLRMKVNTAASQGAFGALKGEKIKCSDIAIETPNEFCSIFVSSREGAPIAEAKTLIVFAVGRSLNSGAVHKSDRAQFKDAGKGPVFMEPVMGSIEIKNSNRMKAYSLNPNGRRIREIPLREKNGMLILDLTGEPLVVYYELTSEKQ